MYDPFRYVRRVAVHLVACLGLLGGSLALAETPKDTLRDQVLKLNTVTGKTALDGKLRELVKTPENTKKLIPVAVELSKEKESPLNFNGAYTIARAAHFLKDYDNAQVLYRFCAEQAKALQSPTKLVDVYDHLIDLYFENRKFDEAVKVCQEFLEMKDDERLNRIKPFVMERMIQSISKQGKHEQALKLTEGLIEADEDGWYFLQLKGFVLREAGKIEEATNVYLTVIDRLNKNKQLPEEDRERFIARIRYQLSGLYVDIKQIDKAIEQLRILVKKYPDRATYKNDLGYILADHDRDLDEAEQLIRKALEIDEKDRQAIPDLPKELNQANAAYLDSLGWVLFKKKNYAEAKKYLLQAVELPEGQHMEILDHLAETHLALGEKDKAIEVWKKALKAEDLSPRDKERRKMIEAKIKKLEESK